MNTVNLTTPEGVAGNLIMATNVMKWKLGVMKSTAGYAELLNTYIDRIATTAETGTFVVSHRVAMNGRLVSKIEQRHDRLKVALAQEPMIVGAALFALDRASKDSPSSGVPAA